MAMYRMISLTKFNNVGGRQPMKFFKFAGKNKALIMAEDKEKAIEIFEFRVSDFDETERITEVGQSSANVIIWEADMDFDSYITARRAIREKEESVLLYVNGTIY